MSRASSSDMVIASETALYPRSALRQCMHESACVFTPAPDTESNAANLNQIMDKRVAAATQMHQSSGQYCRRLPGPHATAASGVPATHQGYGSEARDAGGDLSGAQEEGQQQEDTLQGVGVQLGRRDHGQHSQRLRKHGTAGGQSLMTGTGRQAGMEKAHSWMPHTYASAAQLQAPMKGCSGCGTWVHGTP